ncbi:MAG: MFS transporter [Candidatus Nanohaloarchaea archaeon]
MRYRDNLPLTGANLLRMVYMLGLVVILQLYVKGLGASPLQVSLLEATFWTGIFVFSPLWGALSDASGRRKVFLVASILSAALVIPLFAYADTVWKVLAVRFGFAVLASAFPPVALASMSAGAETGHRGRSLAPYNFSRAAGFLIGWGAAGILVDLAGFRYAFYAMAGVGVLGFISSLKVEDVDTPEEVSLREVWEKARSRWVPSIHDPSLRERGLNYLYLSIFLRKAGILGLNSLVVVYAVDVVGLSASFAGLMLAFNPLLQILFIDLFGTVVDRHGRKKVILLGFLGTVPVPLLLSVASGPVVFGAAYALVGFSFAAVVQGTTAFIGDVAPENRQGELMGFRRSAQGFAGITGPLIAGTVATAYGYTEMLYILSGLMFLGLLTAYLGTRETLEDTVEHVSLGRDVRDTFSFLHG